MTWSLRVRGQSSTEVFEAFKTAVSSHCFIPESYKPQLIEAAGLLLRAFPVSLSVSVSTSGRMTPEQGRVGLDVGTDTCDL